jgi:signal transduction histidine kinase
MKWIFASAALLATGMIVAGVIAGNTLRARDALVREGILTKTAHAIERELRENGPDGADAVVQRFIEPDAGVAAIEVRTDSDLIAQAGTATPGEPLQQSLFLGPGWRELAGPMQRGRGHPPFFVRIWPSPAIGDVSRLAALMTWGSVIAALTLLAFAAAAARGLTARQQSASIDAERRRLEVVSAAGAGLAHRIRNPLATIKATAQILESQCANGSGERARRIVDASVRIETLVDELLRFARPVEIHPEEIDLGEAARSVVDGAEISTAVRVHADREHVTSAIEELVANARALDGQREPEVVVSRRGRQAVVEVRDRGPGLQIEAARAFEPYVTTRANGTGLGLSAVRSLIRANGGDVTIANREGGGCLASIILPAASS